MAPYALLADVVLALHVLVVVFVVGGLMLVLVGNALAWRWVNHLWFRLLHLGAIAVVVAQSWFGITCPLTTLENRLRAAAGQRGRGPVLSSTGCSGCCSTKARPGSSCCSTRRSACWWSVRGSGTRRAAPAGEPHKARAGHGWLRRDSGLGRRGWGQ